MKETTKAICETDPEWDETFEFEIDEDQEQGGSVQIELMDWDR